MLPEVITPITFRRLDHHNSLLPLPPSFNETFDPRLRFPTEHPLDALNDDLIPPLAGWQVVEASEAMREAREDVDFRRDAVVE